MPACWNLTDIQGPFFLKFSQPLILKQILTHVLSRLQAGADDQPASRARSGALHEHLNETERHDHEPSSSATTPPFFGRFSLTKPELEELCLTFGPERFPLTQNERDESEDERTTQLQRPGALLFQIVPLNRRKIEWRTFFKTGSTQTLLTVKHLSKPHFLALLCPAEKSRTNPRKF